MGTTTDAGGAAPAAPDAPVLGTASPPTAAGAATAGNRQWLRTCRMVVGSDNADTIIIPPLRIRFTMTSSVFGTPSFLSARIYNLSNATAEHIQSFGPMNKDNPQAGYATGGPTSYTPSGTVVLYAGYGTNEKIIFTGQIIQTRRGREAVVETFLDIFAQHADMTYNWGVLNFTVAANQTAPQILKQIVKELQGRGIAIDVGYTPDNWGNGIGTIRAQTLSQPARDALQTLADGTDCAFKIEDNKINFMPLGGTLPDKAIVLRSVTDPKTGILDNTGLIGQPTNTNDGVHARCLLNPLIKVNTVVQIQHSIFPAQLGVGPAGLPAPQNMMLGAIEIDGFYKVIHYVHTGDTYGSEWFTDLICITVDAAGQPKNANSTIKMVSGPG